MPMVWQVDIDGRKMYVFDLPIEDCEEIAKRHNISWLSPIDSPLQSAGVATALIAAVAKKLGVPTPALPSVRVLYDLFQLVEDDLPAEHADGIPKSVPAQDGLVTTG